MTSRGLAVAYGTSVADGHKRRTSCCGIFRSMRAGGVVCTSYLVAGKQYDMLRMIIVRASARTVPAVRARVV